ncbi:MAG: serine/threonine protein kinase [Symploca sp. SIO2E6]|nr:serine/threonine protein kinase [Symploca sp. SIO2E6]
MVLQQGQYIRDGEYQIIEKLQGRGGFGVTYSAIDTKLNQWVAIKTPDEDLKLDPDYIEYEKRFIKEGQRLSDLLKDPHPNIVQFKHLFKEEETYYLVMEFIPGESLFNRVRSRGLLSEVEAVSYIQQIGSALDHLHMKYLVHRDAHPGNIMLQDNGEAVLIDFGIAGEMFPNSITSKHFGNKAFAPYEQRKGDRNPTIDVYTLAASLYYAVTGRYPVNSFEQKHENAELKPPQAWSYWISDELNYAILQGMAIEPEDRPQSMREWLQLLPPVSADYINEDTEESYPEYHYSESYSSGFGFGLGCLLILGILGVIGFSVAKTFQPSTSYHKIQADLRIAINQNNFKPVIARLELMSGWADNQCTKQWNDKLLGYARNADTKLSEGFEADKVVAEFHQRYAEVDKAAESQNCELIYAPPPKQQKPNTVGLRGVSIHLSNQANKTGATQLKM